MCGAIFVELPAVSGDEREVRHAVTNTQRRDHKSQSERDWAYANRALARGDDPELVIQRIADYRSDDKADPDYYAQLTVAKAQAHLQSRSVETPAPQEDAGYEPQRRQAR